MANIVCFLAARVAKADWDVRADGVRGEGTRTLRAYCSAETHTWIQKAADLSGMGTRAVRWIPTDDDQRMSVAALAASRSTGPSPPAISRSWWSGPRDR